LTRIGEIPTRPGFCPWLFDHPAPFFLQHHHFRFLAKTGKDVNGHSGIRVRILAGGVWG
jgi:hypothetical protein